MCHRRSALFSVKRIWPQEVVTERNKLSRLFTNQIVKNAQELIGLEGRIVLRIQVDNSVHPVTAGFNAMLVSADEGAGAVFIVNE